jgi:dolichol kinase
LSTNHGNVPADNGHAPSVDEVRHIRQITLGSEFVRKGIHLVSLSIPTVYFFIEKSTALWILGSFAVFSLIIDIGRHYSPGLRVIVNKVFGNILREHERDSKKMLLSGATWVVLSAILCILLFPKLITVTAFSILIISDAASALFGRAFGKRKFLDKSLEGSTAFVLSAWVVVALAPKAEKAPIEYLAGAIGAVVGAIVEAASVRLRLDDNLSVPVSIGITMWLVLYLFQAMDPATYGALYETIVNYK